MGFIAAAIAVAGAASAGATVISANKQAKAAEKAAESQKEVALKQLQAPLDAEKAAAETAREKLRLRQASQTKSVLSVGTNTLKDNEQLNKKTILGVG